MSRIRSIHPALFTDEAFMALTVATPLAIPLLIGLWAEADDAGVFEWKPLTIKARVLPAVSSDISGLLDALIVGGFIRQFEQDGRSYGAVRNFCKYQKPRKPKYSHPLPCEMKAFVAFGYVEPPAVPQKSVLTPVEPPAVPQKSEKSFQREDGGGRREEGKGIGEEAAAAASLPAAAALPLDFEEIRAKLTEASGWNLGAVNVIGILIDKGHDFETRILPLVRDEAARRKRQGTGPPDSWAYFTPVVQDPSRQPAAGVKKRPCEFVPVDSERWQKLIADRPKLRAAITSHNGREGVWDYGVLQ